MPEPQPDPPWPLPDAVRRLERWAGSLSLAAGAIHGLVTPTHFEQWWGYGLFFLFAAAAQVIYGLALWTHAINPDDTGPSWARLKRWLYVAGIAGNLAIFALYAATRTVGIPWFGPEAGTVEDVGLLDVLSKIAEGTLILLLVLLLRRAPGAATTR